MQNNSLKSRKTFQLGQLSSLSSYSLFYCLLPYPGVPVTTFLTKAPATITKPTSALQDHATAV